MNTVAQAILSTGVGVAFVVLARLIDRFIPDTTGKHPLPPMQAGNVDSPKPTP